MKIDIFCMTCGTSYKADTSITICPECERRKNIMEEIDKAFNKLDVWKRRNKMADCINCVHYDVCRALDNGDDCIEGDCTDYLKLLPVGEWFVTKDGYFKCSQCGYEPNFVIGEKMYPLPATTYCPKCGTKMPSEEKKLEERKANFLTKCLSIPVKEE